MEYLEIPKLKKPVSKIILGTGWFMPQYEEDIESLLDAYVAAGGNSFDTGRFYSGGKSEKVFSAWLRRHLDQRDKFVITSKACHHYVDENNVHHVENSRVSAEYITEDLEHSLELQGHSYFDVYMMHRDDVSVPVSQLMDRLERHRREGKILTYGLSNWSLARIQEAVDYCRERGYQGPTVNSPGFSLAKVTEPRFYGAVYADEPYMEWHRGKDMAVLAWGAQAVGFFADIYKRDGSAPADIVKSYFSEVNFARLQRAKELAAKKGCESVNVALAYVLEQQLPLAAIIAPHNVKELNSSLHALDVHLSQEEMDWLCNG